MARVLYLDCFSGISGDMFLGACLDAGLPLDDLRAALGSLALSGFDVRAERVLRAGVSATKFITDQGSGIRDQGSGIRDQGSGIRDQGSGIRDQGSGIRKRHSEIRNLQSAIRGSGIRQLQSGNLQSAICNLQFLDRD